MPEGKTQYTVLTCNTNDDECKWIDQSFNLTHQEAVKKARQVVTETLKAWAVPTTNRFRKTVKTVETIASV